MKSLKERMNDDGALIGTIISMGLPIVSEMISRCGFDWLWIDMEHSPLSLEQTQGILQAKANDCAGFVRIPGNEDSWIKRVLDLGADGIIVPQVNTAEQAKRAVASAKYPPTGTRSAGVGRANGFGMNLAQYVREANERVMVFLQIEQIEGVRNADAILQVPGIDAIIIGPYDMSGSLGKLGNTQDPEVQEAISTVHKACKKHGIPIGIFLLQPEQAHFYIEQGYKMIAVGIDSHYLWSAAKKSLEAVRA